MVNAPSAPVIPRDTEPTRSVRLPLMDGMRALAILGVLGVHLGHYSGANVHAWYAGLTSHLKVGVNVFFLISAFLLYRPHALSLLGGPNPPPTRVYVRRRMLRIAPAYWIALTLLAIWPGLPGVLTRNWWIFYGFAQAYNLETVFQGIPAAWSLTVEVGFYAALPALAWLLNRLCQTLAPAAAVRRQLVVLATLGAIGEVLRLSLREAFPAVIVTFPGLLLDFSVGMALAVLHANAERTGELPRTLRAIALRPGACWTAAACLYVGISMTKIFPRGFETPSSDWALALQHPVYVLFATALLLPAVFGDSSVGLPRRFLASRSLQWIGMTSYGVFLYHQPILIFLAASRFAGWIHGWPLLSLAALGVPISLLCGAASHRWVEQPAMRLRSAPYGVRRVAPDPG